MSNSYYTHSGFPATGGPGSSASMRAELDLISAGFDKLPALTGHNYQLISVDVAGTGLVSLAGIVTDGAGALTLSGALTTTDVVCSNSVTVGGNVVITGASAHTGLAWFLNNVGIGTNSPSTKLHLVGADPYIRVDSTSTAGGVQLYSSSAGPSALTGRLLQIAGSYVVLDGAAGVGAMLRVDNASKIGVDAHASGRVSIGTSTLVGGGTTTSALTVADAAGGNLRNGSVSIGADPSAYGLLNFTQSTGVLDIGSLGASAQVTLSTQGTAKLTMDAGGVVTLTGTTDHTMYRKQSNAYCFDVHQNAGATYYMHQTGQALGALWNINTGLVYQWKINNAAKMTVTSGGNLLLGTTTDASRKLLVKGNISALSPVESGVLDINVDDSGAALIAPYSVTGSYISMCAAAAGAGAVERMRVASTQVTVSVDLLSTGAGGIGYGAGSGGTVTQLVSKSTGVTLNKLSGQVTMNSAALAAGASVFFTVSNSAVGALDVPHVVLTSGAANAQNYEVKVDQSASGSFVVKVTNVSGGSLSEALVLNFVVFRGSNS